MLRVRLRIRVRVRLWVRVRVRVWVRVSVCWFISLEHLIEHAVALEHQLETCRVGVRVRG